jgi:hypothetical protein
MAGKVHHTGLSDFIAITVTFKTKLTFFLVPRVYRVHH